MIRPLFRFFGSKWTLAPHYPMPAHPVIVEPFAGSAGYSTRYYDRQIILCEKDPKIAAVWAWLVAADPAEIRALPLLDPGERIPDSIQGAARWFVGFWCTTTGAKPQERLVPSSAQIPASHWCAAVRERTAEAVQKIRHWIVWHGDYRALPFVGPATWFIDPPYQHMGKCYSQGKEGIDFAALAEWCRARQGQVIVCENEGADWLPFEPFRASHACPRKGIGRVTREAIWTCK